MTMEEIVPRWGARSSKPGGAVKRSLVGSTPALFRHFSWQPQYSSVALHFSFSHSRPDLSAQCSNRNGLAPKQDTRFSKRYFSLCLKKSWGCHLTATHSNNRSGMDISFITGAEINDELTN
jgi:hypothetical protein